MKILFSNLGYATGIDGTLGHHARKALRHAFQTKAMQHQVLLQFGAIIEQNDPDLCCLIEIDRGSAHSNAFNQIEALRSTSYPVFDIADKYGPRSRLSKMPFHHGKSNGFISKASLEFSHLYFESGSKRLIYKIHLAPELSLFFAHFSLSKKVRTKQFLEMRKLIESTNGHVILLGDFNIFTGLGELEPLVAGNVLQLLNPPGVPTFRFHRWQHMLDLCLCSPSLVPDLKLNIIKQSFSDHDALLVELG
jgi:endonuclease/exonuclease/phosphatase family metal-dependent hydrolase